MIRINIADPVPVKPRTFADWMAQSQPRNPDVWVPACGGTEQPFTTRTGRRIQYLWNKTTGEHAYIDCMTDIILTTEEAQAALG